ncbi:MAG: GDP-mannose 4,6-dehydratase, partial [Candidatus Tectomicrobia bacterium]|nr:GDP-mannose 4,6-dehydratase [Candidatus Tectomicrobia bacterium]
HLTERLVQMGAQVRAFVHYNARNDWGLLETVPAAILKEVEIFAGDLTDPSLVRTATANCEIVFHLGALIAIPYSYQAPRQFITTNVLGALNVFQACLEEKVERVVHTSTSESYGSARYTPIDEAHPLQAQSPYAASKIAADKLAESFYCSFNLPVAIIRPFNTFGPRQSARAVIPAIITQALTCDAVKLGLVTPIRDLTFVEDTVSAFVKIAASDKSIGEVFNVGTGRGVTIGDLAKMTIKILDEEKPLIVDSERIRPAHSEVMALICDNTKARDMLGWEPTCTLELGLQHTVDYIRDHLDRYKPSIFNR